MDYEIRILLFITLASLSCISSSNILIVVPYAIHSHYIMFRPLGFELAERGHNVTVITAFKEVNHPPNYHQVMADFANIWQITGMNFFDAVNLSAEQFHNQLVWPGGLALTEVFLNSSEIVQFISENHKFDVVIMEHFVQDALYILAHKYNAPLVLITTFGNCGRQNIITRNPLQLHSVVSEILNVDDPSSFIGTLRNIYFTAYEYYWWNNWFLVKQEELVKKYFSKMSEPVPSLYELQKNAAIFMINSYFSFDPPTAYLPNIVELGGIHITDTVTKLPENLQNILDRSNNGVVYVNFGSVLQSSQMPVEKRNVLLNVFKKLNHTVLWKWEDDSLLDIPPNLMLQKWMPQKQILCTNIFDVVNLSAEQFHKNVIWPGGIALTEIFLNSSELAQFIREDHHFDVVVMEHFVQEAMYMLAHKYNAPLILMTTFGNCGKQNIITRNPLQLASVVSEFAEVKEPSSFLGRLRNVYFTAYEYYWWKNWFLVKQEELVKKYFSNLSEPVPSLYDLQKNAAIFMINSHFSFDPPTAYLPNIVEIGGVEITETLAGLSENLQNILHKSNNGVVYVNFGSNVQSSQLPVEKRNALINVFKRLNHTVLWKWEDDSLLDVPLNLVLQKWMPQKEILSHPNTKVFISHGGLMGTQEAVYYGVPIIGVPIFADQYNNVLQIQDAGIGRMLTYSDINEENLENLLHEFLTNDSYTKRAKMLSQRFKDRPISPLNLVIFWIEYVIKNKGAECLRHPGLNITWIEYNMLDVYTFLLFVLLIFIFISYTALMMSIRVIFKLMHTKIRLSL